MKSLFAYFAGLIALPGSSSVLASEAYVVPDAVTPWIFDGTIYVSRTVPIPCRFGIVLSGPNDRSDTSPPFDHSDVSNLSGDIEPLGFCRSILQIAPILPGDITHSNGSFTFHNVYLTEPAGTCLGDLTAVLNETASPPLLTISGTLPASSGPPCTLSGTIELYQPGTAEVREPGDPDHDPHQNI